MSLLLRIQKGSRSKTRKNFTFHYVSITTAGSRHVIQCIYHFTFHYVSITTPFSLQMLEVDEPLHSTMSLLLLLLDPNMFACTELYIPLCLYYYTARAIPSYDKAHFTFHYVSITTLVRHETDVLMSTLYIPLCLYYYWECC